MADQKMHQRGGAATELAEELIRRGAAATGSVTSDATWGDTMNRCGGAATKRGGADAKEQLLHVRRQIFLLMTDGIDAPGHLLAEADRLGRLAGEGGGCDLLDPEQEGR